MSICNEPRSTVVIDPKNQKQTIQKRLNIADMKGGKTKEVVGLRRRLEAAIFYASSLVVVVIIVVLLRYIAWI